MFLRQAHFGPPKSLGQEAESMRLSRLGIALAIKTLEDEGFRGVKEIKGRYRSYGALLASQGSRTYVIEVRTRRKYSKNGRLNRLYKLAESGWDRSPSGSAAVAERRFRAKAHWLAVQIDGETYSVYFGSLAQLRGKSAIPMDDSKLREYEYLAENKNITAAVAAVPPKVTQNREEDWDVFISHANEDKKAIARPLAKALGRQRLRRKRLRVWYDEFSLRVGAKLRKSIEHGLAHSRFGVVILSRHFFAKHWPREELDALATREIGGQNVILPVWHGVGFDYVRQHSPMLADRIAATTDKGLKAVVEQLLLAMK